MAWFLVLRRLDEGNFEAGGPLHPPWTPVRLRFFRRFLGAATADESHARLSYWDVRSRTSGLPSGHGRRSGSSNERSTPARARDLTRRKIATLPDRGAVSRGVGGTAAQGNSGTLAGPGERPDTRQNLSCRREHLPRDSDCRRQRVHARGGRLGIHLGGEEGRRGRPGGPEAPRHPPTHSARAIAHDPSFPLIVSGHSRTLA